MSAFVVSTETMDRVVRALIGLHNGSPLSYQIGGVRMDAPDAATKVGRLLFTLNIEAVMQRYPDTQDDPSQMPGAFGCYAEAQAYCYRRPRHVLTRAEMIDSLKAMRSLIYQCSEGDVHKTDLYRDLRYVAGELAARVVETLPEYSAAKWGG